ncbi:MAG: ABC transporter permease [Acidobacteria bacterium]|nr:ABC transporter permease [Acidobacteriota bacterium]
MTFLTLPVKNLASHRVRSVLTALGIAAAVASLLALVGLSRGVERNWVVSLEGKGTHIIGLQKGSIEMLSASLDETLAEGIRRVPGVAAATAGLGDLVELESGQMTLVSGWPLDSDFWKTLNLTAGKAPDESAPESVALGETLANLLAKGPGDSIQVGGRDFKIAGVTRQASVLDDRSVLIPLATMQRLIGREGKASGFHIRVAHPEDAEQMVRTLARLAAEFPALTFVESGEIAKNTHVTRLLRALAWSSSSIALAMAFVAVLNTLLMSVTERMREFGLLCAIGWKTSRVLAMVVLEGFLLAAAGAAAGVGLGLASIRWIMRHPQLGGLLQPDVTPRLVFEAVLLALLLGVLTGLYPAWRATRLDPIRLLRSE